MATVKRAKPPDTTPTQTELATGPGTPPANDAPCHQHKVSSAHLGGSSKYLYETYEDPSRSGKRFHVNSPLPTGLKYLTMSQKPTTHPPPWAPLLQFQAPHYSSDIYEKYVYFSIFPVALL